MREYESLREDLDGIAAAMSRYAGAVSRYTSASDKAIKDLWTDAAELRDELHALANRVETLTRARLTEPAEVAARIMPDRCEACGAPIRIEAGRIFDEVSGLRGALHTCRVTA